MNNIFDKYYKKYDAWYDRNKFAYLSELKANTIKSLDKLNAFVLLFSNR